MLLPRPRLLAASCAALLPLLASCESLEMGSPGNSSDPMLIWKSTLPALGPPALDEDHAYFVLGDHRLAALDRRSGAVRWLANTVSATAVAPHHGAPLRVGRVVVTGDWDLFGFDAFTGNPRWAFRDTAGPGVNGFATDGARIYAGSITGIAFAIDAASGAELWRTELLPGALHSVEVAAATAGIAWLVVRDLGRVFALDAATGRALWDFALPREGTTATNTITQLEVAVSSTTRVVTAFDDGRIAVLNGGTGAVSAIIPATVDRTRSGDILSIVVDTSTVVASTIAPNRLNAWTLATGSLRWSKSPDRVPVPVFGWYALGLHDDVVLACMPTSSLGAYQIDTGNPRWVRLLPSAPCGQPPVARGNTLFITAFDGTYALRWEKPTSAVR